MPHATTVADIIQRFADIETAVTNAQNLVAGLKKDTVIFVMGTPAKCAPIITCTPVVDQFGCYVPASENYQVKIDDLATTMSALQTWMADIRTLLKGVPSYTDLPGLDS